MKYLIRKDKINRSEFVKIESKRRVLRSIIQNRFIEKKLRNTLAEDIANIGGIESKIVNRCLVTGRARGILRRFKVSRMVFKDLASRGILPGIKKASW